MRKSLSFALLLFVLCSFSVVNVSAQNEKQLKSLNVDSLMNPSHYPKRVHSLQFLPQTDIYVFVKSDTLWFADSKKDAKKSYLLSDLNALLKAQNEKEMSRFPAVQFISADEFTFYLGYKFCVVNTKNKTLTRKATMDSKAANFSTDHKTAQVAYTKENSLYLMKDGKEIEIASTTEKDVVFGQAVHQREFGIDKGIFFSPDAGQIAFYRMDESMVTDYPLVNTATRIATETPLKYPMAGMKSHHVTIGVYNIQTTKTVYLKTLQDTTTAEKENYLTNVTWSPDNKNIYIQKLNRKQNHLKLECYDAATGDLVKVLLEEKSDKYVEPQHELYFVPTKNNEFIYFSQRDGFFHLYLYNTDGKLIKQLTKGDWLVKNITGFNDKGTHCFFYATKDSPLETNFYSVELKSGKIERITPEKGTHTVVFNTEGNLFIDAYSNYETPYKVCLIKNGKNVKDIYEAENPLKDYLLPQAEISTIKAADGKTDLYCRLIKPANFDPNKKYPVIVYVYGGPHAQMITNTWFAGATTFQYYLAQLGYLVWTVDSRGSGNRGFEFESAIHRHLGTVEIADQMEGVKYLKSLPYVDSTRMGVDGWSYGGFMTISLKLQYPETFKVATAGGPVVDWKWYEIMYGERYAGTPQDNAEGYAKASLINQAKNLQGKLLVIHGAQDPVVVWQHSLQFIDECIKQNKQVDYFVYPFQKHNVTGIQRCHLIKKIADYYQQNL